MITQFLNLRTLYTTISLFWFFYKVEVFYWIQKCRYSCLKVNELQNAFLIFLTFPKNQQKIWQISALESKKWSNHKINAHYNDWYILYLNYIKYYETVSLFCWYDHFLYSRAEICQIFRRFFGKFKISRRHSKINWPLRRNCSKSLPCQHVWLRHPVLRKPIHTLLTLRQYSMEGKSSQ